MKLEVVVIPVADVERAEQFYRKLAAAGRDAAGLRSVPVHAARLSLFDPIRPSSSHRRRPVQLRELT